ncbi:MFS transporter [Dysgonomonas sp. ZJ709]|uniref:MFS transporter n=1 Tax=Dysgonomonas sp. ZJ709 TaxID=2709797 RepID=UPI0013EB474F|nr:MFS transporter [Dysgonomonas sp. ZJ709]
MIKQLIAFFSPVPEKEELAEDKKYLKKLQWSVFLSATIGYGLYYVCRLSLSVVKKPLVDGGILTENELGIVGSALFFAYAVGKFANGFMADRVNIKRFMAIGLLISALVNITLGFSHSFWAFVILWGVNGWAQSMGAPASVVGLSRWFTDKERGSYYGFWSASHNIGEALTFIATAFVVSIAGWRWGFEAAGIAGLIGAVVIMLFMHDSPTSKGLPPIMPPKELGKSVGATQLEVLKNPFIWILALSSACMYISRYAINSWGIFFLENEKSYTSVEASSIIAVSSVCGIIGTVLSGILSDKLFKGNRNVPALIFGIGNTIAIALFVLVPKGYFAIDIFSMVLFGLSIGVLICYLGGLMAVDIAPKKASGAALGVIGIASYIGAGLQDILSGSLIGDSKTMTDGIASYDFSSIRYFWIGAAALSFMLCATLWKVKKKDVNA